MEGTDLAAKAGETILIHAEASSPDNSPVQISFRVYADASAQWGGEVALKTDDGAAEFTLPAYAASGDKLHIVVKAQAEGHHRLTHYQQVIITVE